MPADAAPPPVRPNASRRLVRARRAWRNSAARHELAQRRLNLHGLPRTSRRLLLGAGLVGIALAVLLLVEVARGNQAPDLAATVELVTHDWPTALVLGLLAGFAVTQVLVMRLAAVSTRTRRVVLAVLGGLMGLIPPATALRNLHGIGEIYRDEPSAAFWVGVLALALGGFATVVGVILAVGLGRTAWAYLVVLPLVLYAVGYLGVLIAGSEFSGSIDNRFPESLPVAAAVANGVVMTGFGVAGIGLAVTLWQAIEAARGTRDAVGAAGVFVSRWARKRRDRPGLWLLLASLLAAKLVWIALGVSGVLPRLAGGGLDVWSDISGDGWVSWLVAFALGVLVVVWLGRGSPGPREGADLVLAIALVVGGLALAEIAFQGLAFVARLGLGDWALAAARNVDGMQPWATVLVIALACVGAVMRWLAGDRGAGTLFLAAFGLWGVIRLPAMVWDLARYPWFPWGFSLPSESEYGAHAGWVAVATLDLALTVLLLGAALAALSGRLRIRLVPLLVVALASTIVAYPAGLVDLVLLSGIGNGIAFVLPLAYLFLFDATGLNKASDVREARLLRVFALTALALTVGVLRAYFGDPVAAQDVELAASLLLVPALVMSIVTMVARPPAAAPTPARAHHPSPAGTSAADLGAHRHA
ncbi:hypothetical protein OG394_13155 [Kribbella sp. NBC_01245]|nr:hypothetical protein [Kribbella sp. NBC_01245]